MKKYGLYHPLILRFMKEFNLLKKWKIYNDYRKSQYKKNPFVSESSRVTSILGSSHFTAWLRSSYQETEIPRIISKHWTYRMSITDLFRAWLLLNHYKEIIDGKINVGDKRTFGNIFLSNMVLNELRMLGQPNVDDLKTRRERVVQLYYEMVSL